MTIAGGLREAWRLASMKPAPGAAIRASRFEGGGGQILATLTPAGECGLLVALRPNDSLSATLSAVGAASSALGAESYPYTDGGVDYRGLHLWCKRPELFEAFVGFCEPFVYRCLCGEQVHTAFAVCLEEFRRLLSGVAVSEIPPALVGLLGELKVLGELARLSNDALRYWTYPSLERHDFRNGACAIEVKTTLRSRQGRRVVSISALDQLEPPAGGALFLAWMRFERDPSGGITLASLLEDVAQHLSGQGRVELQSRVRAVTEAGGLQSVAFALHERQSYRVDEAFPRLTPSRLLAGALDVGVGTVAYELDLSAAADFRCAEGEPNVALVTGGHER